MKILIASALLLCSSGLLGQPKDFFSDAQAFFEGYVSSGLINYDSLKNNPAPLDGLARQIGNYRIAGKTLDEQKAFYTNAYNLLVIKQIVENYPTEGPMNIPGFFNQKTYRVAGRNVTLDELEKEILFAAFPDPRLHFVLVCAAIGCPPIADYAYMPDSLETQIETKTREVLNISWYVRIYKDRTLVSKVFDWYLPDFVNDAGSVKTFINKYRIIQIPDNHDIATYDYDWSLNDSKNAFRY